MQRRAKKVGYSVKGGSRGAICFSIHAVIEAVWLNGNWTEIQVTYVCPQRRHVLSAGWGRGGHSVEAPTARASTGEAVD